MVRATQNADIFQRVAVISLVSDVRHVRSNHQWTIERQRLSAFFPLTAAGVPFVTLPTQLFEIRSVQTHDSQLPRLSRPLAPLPANRIDSASLRTYSIPFTTSQLTSGCSRHHSTPALGGVGLLCHSGVFSGST
jgi:hypothetical protein